MLHFLMPYLNVRLDDALAERLEELVGGDRGRKSRIVRSILRAGLRQAASSSSAKDTIDPDDARSRLNKRTP